MSTVDDYSDLPDWIRPGARLARLDANRANKITVTKITKTQIVTLGVDGRTVYRFDRTPVQPGYYELSRNPDAPCIYRERGNYNARLTSRADPKVLEILREQAIRSATSHAINIAEDGRKRWNNPTGEEKRLSLDARAMLVLDEMGAAITEAKRKIGRAMVDLPTSAEEKT